MQRNGVKLLCYMRSQLEIFMSAPVYHPARMGCLVIFTHIRYSYSPIDFRQRQKAPTDPRQFVCLGKEGIDLTE